MVDKIDNPTMLINATEMYEVWLEHADPNDEDKLDLMWYVHLQQMEEYSDSGN
jgi:hypothetical protein